MRKCLICFITTISLVFVFVFSSFGLSSHAFKEDTEPFSSLKLSSSFLNSSYSDRYCLLLAKLSPNGSFYYRFLLVKDFSYSGILKVHTDTLPSQTTISDNNYSLSLSSDWLYASGSLVSFPSGFDSYNYCSNFIFSYYNSDKFPTFNNSSTVIILASNVDIFDYNGNLLQAGNYDTLLQYFDNNIDSSIISDFTDRGLTGPTTTTPDDSGDDDSSSDQTVISNNILTNIKNILSLISELPQKIADKIGNYFTDLKNSFVTAIENLKDKLLEGIEYLFMPSDNLFAELQEVLETKFEFGYQILDLGQSVISADFLDVPPNNKITLYGKDIVFMDWSLYDDYKSLIDSIIIIVSYYFYIQRLIKRVPGIIGGFHT